MMCQIISQQEPYRITTITTNNHNQQSQPTITTNNHNQQSQRPHTSKSPVSNPTTILVLHKLARSISHVLHIPTRQQVIATSLVYFKRFFVKNRLDSIDCLLVCAGCFYLASMINFTTLKTNEIGKVEECPIHIKSIVNEMRHLFGANFPYDSVSIAEFEYYLMEDLEFYTIVYHPYRPLQSFIAHLNLEKQFLQTASYIVNDTYRTDLCLLQPPHIIALTALYITNIVHRAEVKEDCIMKFLKSLNVDMVLIAESAQMLFNLYSVWQDYVEHQIPPLLAKLA